ncbi:unnamed protein product [Chrysoparadoxa australica]
MAKLADAVRPSLLLAHFASHYMKTLWLHPTAFVAPFIFDLECIPFRRMLQVAAAVPSLSYLHSVLLPAVVGAAPALFCAHGLLEEQLLAPCSRGSSLPAPLSVAAISSAAAALSAQPRRAALLLRKLRRAPCRMLLQLGEEAVRAFLPRVVLDPVNTVITQELSLLWHRLRALHPCPLKLDALIISLLLQRSQGISLPRGVPYSKLSQEPLLVFRCHSTVFRCPGLLRIILTTLRPLLQSSASCVRYAAVQADLQRLVRAAAAAARPKKKARVETGPEEVPGEDARNRPVSADLMLQVQQSIIVRSLLAVCTGDGEEGEAGSSGSSTVQEKADVIQQACSFLQDIFVDNPQALRVLLSQTCPEGMTEILFSKVPATKLAKKHLPALLSKGDMEAKVFALKIAALFSKDEGSPELYESTKLALLCLDSCARSTSSHNTSLAMLQSVERLGDSAECVAELCQAYPSLAGDALLLLSRVMHSRDFEQVGSPQVRQKLFARLKQVHDQLRGCDWSSISLPSKMD